MFKKMPKNISFKVFFKAILLHIFITFSFVNPVFAKDMQQRLGVGYRNSFIVDVPAVAANYFFSNEIATQFSIGMDTQKDNSRSAYGLGLRRTIFKEANLNFHIGGQVGLVNQEISGSTSSGFDLAALAGVEFFMAGLENLGFSVDTGIAMSSIQQTRFRTVGQSFLSAGIFFYF